MPHTIKLLAVRGERVFMAYQGGLKNQFSLPGGKTKRKTLKVKRKKAKGKVKRRRVEKPVKALRRELKKEFPKLQCAKLVFWKRFRFWSEGGHTLMSVFKGELKGRADAEREVDAGAWIKIGRLDAVPISSNSRRVITDFKHEMSGYRKR